ncbi:AAA-type ATPase lid domain-containing protein [Dickeya oryzae]
MLLAQHFAVQMCRELGLPLFPGFSPQAERTLLDYSWPGNIRELKKRSGTLAVPPWCQPGHGGQHYP